MSSRSFRTVGATGLYFLVDLSADIYYARNFGASSEIIFVGHGVRLKTSRELLLIVMRTTGHPAGGFHTSCQHIVIGILLVVCPWIPANNCVSFDKPNDEDKTADQLIQRYVCHPMIVVVKVKGSLAA